jgi:hypothetical protein
MCWALNHQNILEMAQGHISLSVLDQDRFQKIMEGPCIYHQVSCHKTNDCLCLKAFAEKVLKFLED